MSGIKSYKDLIVWRKSMDLVTLIYKLTTEFPESEKFGLYSQMRRSSISIPSNIAEGWGRNSSNTFKHFLNIANGSFCELETQIILSHDLGYLSEEYHTKLLEMLQEIGKMIFGLNNKIQ